MNYKDNLEIDLIDLAKTVLKHWKAMLICAVIGAVVLGSYGYHKSAVTINADTGEAYTEVKVSDYESLRSKLSAGDIALVETTANQYLGYVKEYLEMKEYGKESIYLNLDAQNVPSMTSLYAIKEENSEEADEEVGEEFVENSAVLGTDGTDLFYISDASNIAAAYNSGLKDSETIEKVKKATGLEVSDGVINELITTGVNGSSILYVTCVGSDKDMCESIMSVLQKRVEELTPSVQKAYDFELTPMNSTYTTAKVTGVDSAQRDYNNYSHTLRVNMNTLSTIIPTEQKEYYNYLVGIINDDFLSDKAKDSNSEDKVIDIADVESVTDLIPEEDVPQMVNTAVVRSFNAKFTAIGFVLGVFMVAFLVAAFYVMSGKLHTADDLRDAFGLSVVGEIKNKEDASRLEVITSGISIAAGKMNASRLAVIGAARDTDADALRKVISENVMAKPGVDKCEICNDVLNSPADMESLAGADAVVMVEKKNASKYENIARELELCSKYEVKVLGVVMMD